MRQAIVPSFILANALLLASGGARATAPPFAGAFAQDGDVAFFKLQADGASEVDLRAYGYGGGTTADGTVVAQGGFDTLLTLYDGSGRLISALEPGGYLNDDGAPGTVNADTDTGLALDSLYQAVLAAGTYWLALTEAPNYGPDYLGNAFSWDGLSSPTGFFGCSQGYFCDYAGNSRTGQWVLDIQGVLGVETKTRDDVRAEFAPPSYVPEPATPALFSLGLAGLSRFRARRAAGR